MRFISDIGRPWTIGEMNAAFKLRKMKHDIAFIAALLNRSVKEIMAIL